MEKQTRVIVTGSRNFQDYELMLTTLKGLRVAWPDAHIVIVHGAYRGADNLAEAAAVALGYETDPNPADWNKHKRGAGPIRNKQMVDKGADLCLGFPVGESAGTYGCMDLAAEADIQTYDVVHKRVWKKRK